MSCCPIRRKDGAGIMEQWKPVVGYEGLYEVSSIGRIKPCHGNPRGHADFLKHSTSCHGYHRVCLFRRMERRYVTVHDLVSAAFIGPKPRGYHVDHKDGDLDNNSLNNFEYVQP